VPKIIASLSAAHGDEVIVPEAPLVEPA
jgi:hypothetical protein